tara:strand:+ start:6880 stop:7344 length:465 start_codon:yes stop_codon:yes gene_type:complete
MRAKDFLKPVKEEEIVEVVPMIGAALGRVGAKMGSAAAKAGVKAGAQLGKVGAGKAKGIGQAAVKAVKKAQDKVSKAILKKGSQIAIPTQGGKETEFDIDDVKGDQVTLQNPEAKPGEPQAFVYNKKELDQIVKKQADKAAGGTGTNPMAGKVV